MNVCRYERPHTLGLADPPPNIWAQSGKVLLLNNAVGQMTPLRDENGKVIIFGVTIHDRDLQQAWKASMVDLKGAITALGGKPEAFGLR